MLVVIKKNELNEEINFDLEKGQEITKNNYLEIISEDKIIYIVQKTIYHQVIIQVIQIKKIKSIRLF